MSSWTQQNYLSTNSSHEFADEESQSRSTKFEKSSASPLSHSRHLSLCPSGKSSLAGICCVYLKIETLGYEGFRHCSPKENIHITWNQPRIYFLFFIHCWLLWICILLNHWLPLYKTYIKEPWLITRLPGIILPLF